MSRRQFLDSLCRNSYRIRPKNAKDFCAKFVTAFGTEGGSVNEDKSSELRNLLQQGSKSSNENFFHVQGVHGRDGLFELQLHCRTDALPNAGPTRLRQRLSLAGEFSPLSEPLSLHQRNDEKRQEHQEANPGQPREHSGQYQEPQRTRDNRDQQKKQRIIEGFIHNPHYIL